MVRLAALLYTAMAGARCLELRGGRKRTHHSYVIGDAEARDSWLACRVLGIAASNPERPGMLCGPTSVIADCLSFIFLHNYNTRNRREEIRGSTRLSRLCLKTVLCLPEAE